MPRSTLQDRITGHVIHGINPGPQPYLTTSEENELSEFLVTTCSADYGKNKAEVKMIAENACRSRKEEEEECRILKSDRITDGWFESFMRRNPCPGLSLRKGDPTANVRMDCLNETSLNNYFDLLKSVLTDNNLMNSPGQIYNVDETGMPLNHRPPNVVAKRGQKKVRTRTTGDKSQVTVVGCVSAVGHVIPPYIIFDAASLNVAWTQNEIPGSKYALSSKGWIDTELFYEWFKHFLQFAVPSRPLLLLLDGHSSHYQPQVLRFAKDNGVIVMCLPPTQHMLHNH